MTNNLQIISSQNNSLVIIEEISEELVWLENFTSKATQKTYKAALTKFCQMFEIKINSTNFGFVYLIINILRP